MTVAENVEVGAVARGRDRRRRGRGARAHGPVGRHRSPRGHARLRALQRRVEIARALAGGPRLLLLDEPAAGMNEAESDALLADASRPCASHDGCTIVIVDHDLRLIMRFCDRIHVLAEGRTIGEGPPTEVRANQAVIDAYLGVGGGTDCGEGRGRLKEWAACGQWLAFAAACGVVARRRARDGAAGRACGTAAEAPATTAVAVAERADHGDARRETPREPTSSPRRCASASPAHSRARYAAYDATLLKGMEYAARKINEEDGPIRSRSSSKNNKGDQAQSATTTQELIDEDIKVFVLTTADPSVAQGTLIAARRRRDVASAATRRRSWARTSATACSSSCSATTCRPRRWPSTPATQGYKSAWMIGSEEIPYTKDMPRYFREAFEQCGGEIVGEDVYKIGQTEFRTQVTKIQNADPAPDVIFSPMFVPDSGVFLKALRGAGVDTPFLSTDGNDSTLFADSGGSAVDGAVYSTHGFPEEGNPLQEFLTDFETVMGAKPESNTFEAIGRDNVYAFVEAAKATELDRARRPDHRHQGAQGRAPAHGQHDDESRHAHRDQGSHAGRDGRHEAELCSRRARRSSSPSRDACQGVAAAPAAAPASA